MFWYFFDFVFVWKKNFFVNLNNFILIVNDVIFVLVFYYINVVKFVNVFLNFKFGYKDLIVLWDMLLNFI